MILIGDALTRLKELADNSVDCCVTSPPYFGLRSYLKEEHPDKAQEIGTERDMSDFINHLVEIFREVRRVLKPHGQLWLNIGDSYAGAGYSRQTNTGGAKREQGGKQRHTPKNGLPAKSLMGIPWRLAFALQDDGWILRQDCIWAKGISGDALPYGWVGSVMPSPVTDRFCSSHEYVFLFSKKPKYYFDVDAIREPHADDWHARASTWREGRAKQQGGATYHPFKKAKPFSNKPNPKGRNRRSVMTVSTASYKGAHFAVFPERLITPFVLAGTSEHGVCSTCGAPWVRKIEKGESDYARIKRETGMTWQDMNKAAEDEGKGHEGNRKHIGNLRDENGKCFTYKAAERTFLGWEPSCKCENNTPKPAIVLDPFGGSGTTAQVAKQLGRDFIIIELNEENLPLIQARINSPLAPPPQPPKKTNEEEDLFADEW
jgi:DNA modification methylase